MTEIIIDQKGPLPIEVQFDNPGDVPIIFEVSGSCYTQQEYGTIGINTQIDGEQVGNSIIWSNSANVHRATVTKYIKINLDPSRAVQDKHTLKLTSMPNTDTDYNDWFSVVMHM